MANLAESVIKRQEALAADRSNWESYWQEIAERVLPSHSNLFHGSQYEQTKGQQKTDKMFDATAAQALQRFASVMESMLVPRGQKWHRLRASDDALNRDRDVQMWFEDVTNLLFRYRYRPNANFSSQAHSNFMALGAFGTGSLFVDELDGGGIRYKAMHLGDLYFGLNHQGLVDTAYRRFQLTARQAIQKFGEERLPSKITDAAETRPEEEFEFIHAVMPRDDMDPTQVGPRGMPFVSYYIAVDAKQVVSEGGYNTFPYPVSRYVTAPGEIYGRGPADIALPSIKTLNEQKKTMLKQGHRVVDPVLLLHDDGQLDSFSLKPGATNYGGVSADGRPLVHTLPTGSLAAGHDMMDQERTVINDAFLVTLFQILVETPAMTATEVLERTKEKGMLLSPTMGRQQSELLGPLIEREIDILARQGLLPPLPPALQEAEGEYEVEYDSPLSRAQRAEEAAGMFRAMEFAVTYINATGDPSPFDHIDIDEAMPAVMDISAVPKRWQRSMDKIEQIRQQRAQAQEAQQAIEAAPAVASLAKSGEGAQ